MLCVLQSTIIIIRHLDNTISTDDDLFQTINRIKCEIGDISGIHTLEQATLYAAQISAVYVGEALLKQNGLLLPDMYKSFLEKLLDTIQSCRINFDQDLYSAANPNWLRSQLSSLLEHHIA